jgi:putative transposase
MANTFTQIYIHFVFSVKSRQPFILPSFKEELHKYITGIIKKRNCVLLAINSMSDHIHLFIAIIPDISISSLMREVKAISSKFINEKKYIPYRFEWQEGYGAFSYSHSQKENVIKYILNQEEHHKKRDFKEEYLEMLKLFNITYEEKYVF